MLLPIYRKDWFNRLFLLVIVLCGFDRMFVVFQSDLSPTTVSLNLVILVSCLLAALSFFIPRLAKESYSRFFLIVQFLVVPAYFVYRFLADALFYSLIRTVLLEYYVIYSFVLVGCIGLYFSNRFSRLSKLKRRQQYGTYLQVGAGIVLVLGLAKLVESPFTALSLAGTGIKAFILVGLGQLLKKPTFSLNHFLFGLLLLVLTQELT